MSRSPSRQVVSSALKVKRSSRPKSRLPITSGLAWNCGDVVDGKRLQQSPATEVKEAAIADGEALQAKFARQRPPLVLPRFEGQPEQRGKSPLLEFRLLEPGQLCGVDADRPRRGRAGPARRPAPCGHSASGGASTAAAVRISAQGPENMLAETPSAIAAIPRLASSRQASSYCCGFSGSLASWKTRERWK